MALEFAAPVESVSLSTIDATDDTFALSPPWRLPEGLVASVGRVGLLTPLLVERGERKLRLIDGFARFRAAAHHGLGKVPVLCATPLEAGDCFLLRLEARLATRPLDELERALTLHKLRHRFQLPDATLVREILPLLGLRAERFQLRRHLDLAVIDTHLQQAMPELQTEIALQLNRWADPERTLFLRLLRRYRLGVNHQREIFNWLDELRHTDSTGRQSVPEIWESSGAREADAQESVPPQERLTLIRSLLRNARYPTLGALEAEAETLRAALRIPPQIQFNWPAYFEGERFSVKFSFRTPAELASRARFLQDLAGKKELQRLVGLL